MNINVKNLNPKSVEIDIEGIIGVSEESQFQTQRLTPCVSTYERFRSEIDKIKGSEVSTLRLNIRSMGGSVQDALLIYEALSELNEGVTIETHCYGFSASAATIIAQAASAGHRYVASTALYMIHRASTNFDGNAAEASTVAELLQKTDQQIAEIYASRSGLSSEHFLEIMNRENGQGEWLSASEAVEAGLADSIEKHSTLKNVVNSLKRFIEQLVAPAEERQRSVVENNEPLPCKVEEIIVDAAPTTTTPKEDPSLVHHSVELSSNKKAYNRDIELFRGR